MPINLPTFLLTSCFSMSILLSIKFLLQTPTRQYLLAVRLTLLTIIFCFFWLIYSFVISDFTIVNVYLNSARELPLTYKISASWSSHEGSILLWVALLALTSLFFTLDMVRNKTLFLYHVTTNTLGIQLLLIATFLAFILVYSNPFTPMDLLSVTDGRGLNPTLQDIGLAIHPPILYFGYVSYSIVFSLTLSLLINKNLLDQFDKDFFRLYKKYSLIAWIFTSAGIALGSWWAYRVLGWGGFWFFDPVENLSLIPLLLGTAFHHSLFATTKTNNMVYSTMLLGIITFLTCLFGTFLVRSGIISSVHSFATDLYRGSSLLAIFGFAAVGSLIIFANSIHSVMQRLSEGKIDNFLTRGSGIYIGNLSLIISATTLLISVIYPLVAELLYGKKIALDEHFYYKIFIPALLPSIFCSAFFGFMTWRENNIAVLKKSIVHIVVALLGLIIYLIYDRYLLGAICIFIGCYTVSYCLYELYIKRKTSTIGRNSMIIAHLGTGLIVISLTIYGNFSQEIEFTHSVDKQKIPVSFANYNFVINDVRYATGTNYYRQIVKINVTDIVGNELTTLTPELRLYKIEDSLVSVASIYSSIFYDFYASIVSVKDQQITVKLSYKPAAVLFLLSCIIMVAGGLMSLIRPRNVYKALSHP